MSAKYALAKSPVSWVKLQAFPGLSAQAQASIQAFRQRNDDAKRKLQMLKAQKTEVDFAHYRSVLKNSAVVDEIEKQMKSFKPVTYDLGKQIKNIEKFEQAAIQTAEKTQAAVKSEIQVLEAALSNIEDAANFEDLSTTDIIKASAVPQIATAEMVKRGQWTSVGWKEKFGDLAMV